jgi:hypothetical protein
MRELERAGRISVAVQDDGTVSIGVADDCDTPSAS